MDEGETLWRDGDLGLLAAIFVVGLLPVIADLLNDLAFGAAATVGGALTLLSGWTFARRVWVHLGARRIQRRLLSRR